MVLIHSGQKNTLWKPSKKKSPGIFLHHQCYCNVTCLLFLYQFDVSLSVTDFRQWMQKNIFHSSVQFVSTCGLRLLDSEDLNHCSPVTQTSVLSRENINVSKYSTFIFCLSVPHRTFVKLQHHWQCLRKNIIIYLKHKGFH